MKLNDEICKMGTAIIQHAKADVKGNLMNLILNITSPSNIAMFEMNELQEINDKLNDVYEFLKEQLAKKEIIAKDCADLSKDALKSVLEDLAELTDMTE